VVLTVKKKELTDRAAAVAAPREAQPVNASRPSRQVLHQRASPTTADGPERQDGHGSVEATDYKGGLVSGRWAADPMA
jgi:hypothetical protein